MKVKENIDSMLQQVKYLSGKTNKRTVLIVLQHTNEEQTIPCVPKVRESICNVIGIVSLGDFEYLDYLFAEANGVVDMVVMDVDPKRNNTTTLRERVAKLSTENGMAIAYYSDYASWVMSALNYMDEVEQHQVYHHQHVLVGKNPLATRMIMELINRGIDVWLLKDEYAEMIFPLAQGSVAITSPYLHYWEGQSGMEKIYLLGCEIQAQSAYLNQLKDVAFDALFDVGICNFTKDFVCTSRKRNARVFRSDDRAGISSVVFNLMETAELVTHYVGRTMVGDIAIVSGGCVGLDGDVVVDNYQDPTTILGIAAGDGTFRTELTEIDNCRIEKLQKLL